MRGYALYLVVILLAIYAWRDWYVSLCGLIVLNALAGHPDMPTWMFGIPGLDPLNALLAAVVVPWLLHRKAERRSLDLPRPLGFALLLYFVLVLVSYLRAVINVDSFPAIDFKGTGVMQYATMGLTYDYLINPLKYILPALMLFDGCRSRRRMAMGLAATLVMPVIYAFLVVRTVPLAGLQQTGKAEMRQRHRIGKRVGFHANSVALVLVPGFWGALAAIPSSRRIWFRAALLAAALLILLGLVMTRSRAGYVALGGVGVLFGVLFWRKYLVFTIVAAVSIASIFPGVVERLATGLGSMDAQGQSTVDLTAFTASRATVIWPPVIDAISASPVVGYGTLGILQSSVFEALVAASGGCPTHPHNAYLEVLLDGGVIGSAIVGFLFGHLLLAAYRVGRSRFDTLFNAVGAAAFAALAALMIMGMSGASFFPRENGQFAWCLFGLALRATAVHQANALGPQPVRTRVPSERSRESYK